MTIAVNIHEARAHRSRLVEQATRGRDFVIAKAGKPTARVLPLEATPTVSALRFLAGHGVVEVDVKEAFATDIDVMFGAVTR